MYSWINLHVDEMQL